MEETTKTMSEQPEAKRQWPMRNCPTCGHLMFIQRQRTKKNERTGQNYIETTYVCPVDDYWLTTKIPRKLAETIIDGEYLIKPGVEETTKTMSEQPEAKRQWPMWNCPVCAHRMFIQRQRTKANEETEQTYIETTYVCPVNDYWLITKMPRKLAASIVDEQYLIKPGDDLQFPL